MSAIRGPPSSPTLMQESCAELRSELNFAASEIDHEAGESSSKLIVQRATGVRCGASCGACPSVASLPFGGGRRPRARGRGRALRSNHQIILQSFRTSSAFDCQKADANTRWQLREQTIVRGRISCRTRIFYK
ncbi:uncharacterized protein LOC126770243 isoform X4 [Nymphalis io]|uniref:uncharacterized protein LOC126770243 isoform X4 n=1 Tax=Inachis io TaxID=171585 RepID=UPI002169D795|nr:uncharacterized protein LOC126770243 isoform X4 [Nymphalis io]